MGQIYYYDNRPASTSPEDLFRFCVKMAIQKKLFPKSLTHNQWANILFSYEDNNLVREDNMSKVKREHTIYFTRDKNKYAFIEEKIKRDFPDLFGKTEDEGLLADAINAVSSEIEEERDPKNIESFKGLDLTQISKQGNSYLYQVLLSVSDNQEPNFHEDTPFEIQVFNDDPVRCEFVDYNYETGLLSFTSNRFLKSARYCKILLDSTFILEGLKQRLVELDKEGFNEDLPFAKILTNEARDLAEVKHKKVPKKFKTLLDDSQREAFDAALDKDVTFIWGPPGTGKSFTLASIIYALYELREDRTAVCCVSNVAVDQLLCKVLDNIENNNQTIEPGSIYRAGRSLDSRVISTDYLFPQDLKTQGLRKRINRNLEEIKSLKERKMGKSEEAILLKAENKNLRDELKQHTESLVKSSRLVFSTISNFALNNSLYNSKFDNLIVDEASMMAMPSLFALGHNISKRIILVGDFQQLSPIALVRVPALTESVFKMNEISIKNSDHPALHQLLHQRRSDEKIVDLINRTFYRGKLIPSAKGDVKIIGKDPFAGKVITLYDCRGEVRYTKGGTRQNKDFAVKVIQLLDKFYQDKTAQYTIGIITPYKGQVSLLRALLREREYAVEFEERIKIGTIHKFQGSECDVIIFDMVDCPVTTNGKQNRIGQLFAGEEGERLLNVAVSRARHKLIMVCDEKYIKNIPGNTVTQNTQSLLRYLGKYRVEGSQDEADVEENANEDESEWYFVESVPFSKTSKRFFDNMCCVVLSTLGYYLEVNGEYIKLGDYPDGFSSSGGNLWIKKPVDDRGLRMVHDIAGDIHLIGYIREDDNGIVYTTPDDEENTIDFEE